MANQSGQQGGTPNQGGQSGQPGRTGQTGGAGKPDGTGQTGGTQPQRTGQQGGQTNAPGQAGQGEKKPSGTPARTDTERTEGTPKSGGASNAQTQKPTEGRAPQYDDRPDQVGRETGSTEAPGKTRTPGVGNPPGYGDKEPGDPRRLDVDAGTGGRPQSGDASNRS